jgi:HK97 family phage prohead protease
MLRKAYLVEHVKQLDDDAFEIVITTDSEDRDGDVIEVGGWEFGDYMLNPVVLLNHESRALPIGQTLGLRIEANAVVAQFKFSTPANESDPVAAVIARWNDGTLRAASVGFRPLEFEPRDEDAAPDAHIFGPFRFTRQALLEWSLVTIPANQDALRRDFIKSLHTGASRPVVNVMQDDGTAPLLTVDIKLPADVIADLHGAIENLKSLYVEGQDND